LPLVWDAAFPEPETIEDSIEVIEID
jgi:hypothetical protein